MYSDARCERGKLCNEKSLHKAQGETIKLSRVERAETFDTSE